MWSLARNALSCVCWSPERIDVFSFEEDDEDGPVPVRTPPAAVTSRKDEAAGATGEVFSRPAAGAGVGVGGSAML